MGQKRHLGLGKAAKAKKSKVFQTNDSGESKQENQITVELDEEVEADDELSQLKALWRTYMKSDKDNEYVLNGVVHECDRILRNQNTDAKIVDQLPDWFHAIYALALADLAKFHSTDRKKVEEFFDAAIERAEIGLGFFADSVELHFSISSILITRIPLQFISALTPESNIKADSDKIDKLLDKALDFYVVGENKADESSSYVLFNSETFEILEALDDLLDMVYNFGKNLDEGEASDDENDDPVDFRVGKNHPLYAIQNTDQYNKWWKDHIITFAENVDKQLEASNIDSKDPNNSGNELVSLKRRVCRRIGQSYLQEAEVPSSVFTTLMYDEDYEGVTELENLTKEDAQVKSQQLLNTALKYLELGEDKEDPDSWVVIAEANISLANVYGVESDEQEELYKKAEKILVKANNATNDKYVDILDNLLQN